MKHFRLYLTIVGSFWMACLQLQAQERKSLAGTWQVKLDPQDEGLQAHWWEKAFPEKAQLPGSLASNNLGYKVSLATPWTGDVIDSSYFFLEKYAKYRQGDIKIPFWLKPKRHFVGPAWYKKTIEIPENWAKKRVLLHLERCHWETNVFVNGEFCGTQNSLVSPHIYDISGYLKAGKKNEIVLRVDNRIKIYIGPNSSSITEHTQTNWNGVIGDISLEAQETTNINDLQIYPRLATSSIDLALTLKQSKGRTFKGNIRLQARSLQANGAIFPVKELPLSLNTELQNFTIAYAIPQAQLWDEFSPNLS